MDTDSNVCDSSVTEAHKVQAPGTSPVPRVSEDQPEKHTKEAAAAPPPSSRWQPHLSK